MNIDDLENKSNDALAAIAADAGTLYANALAVLAKRAKAGGAVAAPPMVPVQLELHQHEPAEESLFDRREKLKDDTLRYVTRQEGTAIYGVSEDTLTRLIRKNPEAGIWFGSTLYIDRTKFRPRKID
jgi:hypothetical protein